MINKINPHLLTTVVHWSPIKRIAKLVFPCERADCVSFSSALPLLVFTQPHPVRRLLEWKFPFTSQRGSILLTHTRNPYSILYNTIQYTHWLTHTNIMNIMIFYWFTRRLSLSVKFVPFEDIKIHYDNIREGL